jgi:hypothetical protein
MFAILAAVVLLAVIQSLTAQPGPGDRGRGLPAVPRPMEQWAFGGYSGQAGFGGRFGRGFSSPEQPPVPANEEEKMILNILEDMNANQSAGMMNVPQTDGRLLRILTEAVGAKHVVEIGTSNGYSGIWFCLALRTTGGKLTTHEIDARRAALADKEGYIDYLNKLLPLVRPGGLILAHNVPGTAPDYVKAVTTNPDLETVFYERGAGVGVTLKKRQK